MLAGRLRGKLDVLDKVDSYATMMHHELGKWFVERYRPEDPFFIFMNYIEPHDPYDPPSKALSWTSDQIRKKWLTARSKVRDHMLTGLDLLSADDLAELEALYDEEIAYVDRKLGRLFTFLADNGLDENTLVIITSDHGEHFGELPSQTLASSLQHGAN